MADIVSDETEKLTDYQLAVRYARALALRLVDRLQDDEKERYPQSSFYISITTRELREIADYLDGEKEAEEVLRRGEKERTVGPRIIFPEPKLRTRKKTS